MIYEILNNNAILAAVDPASVIKAGLTVLALGFLFVVVLSAAYAAR